MRFALGVEELAGAYPFGIEDGKGFGNEAIFFVGYAAKQVIVHSNFKLGIKQAMFFINLFAQIHGGVQYPIHAAVKFIFIKAAANNNIAAGAVQFHESVAPHEVIIGVKDICYGLKDRVIIQQIAGVEEVNNLPCGALNTFIKGIGNTLIGLAKPAAIGGLGSGIEPFLNLSICRAINNNMLKRRQELTIYRCTSSPKIIGVIEANSYDGDGWHGAKVLLNFAFVKFRHICLFTIIFSP